MNSVFESYADVVKNELGYYPVFLPGYPLSLGDFGTVDDGKFTREGSVKNFDFIVKELTGEAPDNKIDFSKGVDFKVSLAPSITAPGMFEASLKIAFGDSSNVFFSFNNCQTTLIDNYQELKKKIIELYNKGDWVKDYYVITELIKADRSTVILADSSEAEIDFGVAIPIGANIPIPQLKMDFLDGKLDVNESFSSNISTKIIAKSGLKPLIKLSKLKVKLSGEAKLDAAIYKGIVDEISDKFGRDRELSVDTDKLESDNEIVLTLEEVDVKEI
ncbi:hypothetical protein [Acetobacterium sp.]|uniref:hypothetical protein n=1 Tax=Acetobacterium sp. TaxID=1872094 RepID=UPI002725F6EF|nr:hypothetical protein [Acetobacterium sp.]MDO9491252.1 hypothetical protein [Acetobacterium sp.]